MSRTPVFRFCVGGGGSARSTVWKVWTTKSDVYLQSRMMGRTAKLSFHESGEARFSRTDDWVRKTGARNVQRLIHRWHYNRPRPSKANLLFRIVIPRAELQSVGIPRRASQIIWLSPPEQGSALAIDGYLARGDPAKARTRTHPHSLLGVIPARPPYYVLLLTHHRPLPPSVLHARDGARPEIRDKLAELGKAVRPGYRSFIFAARTVGHCTIIELDPHTGAA